MKVISALPVTYLHLKPEAVLPDVAHLARFRVVIIVESNVTSEWQEAVSEWLVQSGCLYAMAWGERCSSWDDSIDEANVEAFAGEDIPDDSFVVTTWHADESLDEVFWFSKHAALHPTVNLHHTVLLHISSHAQESRLAQWYAQA